MYDLVLFGATGVTGALTAGYLAGNVPSDCRWALAGRSTAGLEALRRRLAGTDPRLSRLPLLHADAADPESLRSIAENTRVVVTTVGPYTRHGGPLVEACARAGTDYLDLCGESEFVDETYLRHHATAAANGARLVHSCGFDSVPYPGRSSGGVRWLIPPDGSGTLTDPSVLELAMHEAAARLAREE